MDSNHKEDSVHEHPFSLAFLWPVHWAVRLTFLTLALLLLTWFVYLVCMHFLWEPGAAVAHTRALLSNDLEVVSHVGGEFTDARATHLAITIANGLYWLVWEATGIHGAMTAFADPAPRGMLDTYLRNVLITPFAAEIFVLMDATKIFGVRFSVFVTALPVFVLAYAAGTVDGLVQRYIRRSGAGREHTSLSHRAKHAQMGGGALLGLIYVCLPITIDPQWIMLPAAGVIAILSRVQWTYYSKYL